MRVFDCVRDDTIEAGLSEMDALAKQATLGGERMGYLVLPETTEDARKGLVFASPVQSGMLF